MKEPEVAERALLYIPRRLDRIAPYLTSDIKLTKEQLTHPGKFVVVRRAGDLMTGQSCIALTGDQCSADKTGNRCATMSAYMGFSKSCGMTPEYQAALMDMLNDYALHYSSDNKPDMPSRFPVRAILLDAASANETITKVKIDMSKGRLHGPDLIDLLVVRFQQGELSYGDMLSAIYAVSLCEDLDYSRQTARAMDYLIALAMENKRVPLHSRIQFLNEQLQEPEELESNPEIARVRGGRLGGGSSTLTKLAVLTVLLTIAGSAAAGDVGAPVTANATQVAKVPFRYAPIPGLLRQRPHPTERRLAGNVTDVAEDPTGILLDYFGGSNNEALRKAVGGNGGEKAGESELLTLEDNAKIHKAGAAKYCTRDDSRMSCTKKMALAYAKEGKSGVDETFKNLKPTDAIGQAGKGFFSACIFQNVLTMYPDTHAIILLERVFNSIDSSRSIRRTLLINFLDTKEFSLCSPGMKDLINNIINGRHKGNEIHLEDIVTFQEAVGPTVDLFIDRSFEFAEETFKAAGAEDIAQAGLQFMKDKTSGESHDKQVVRTTMRQRVQLGNTGRTVAGSYNDLTRAGVDTRDGIRFMVLSDVAGMSTFDHIVQPSARSRFSGAMQNSMNKIFNQMRVPLAAQQDLRDYILSEAREQENWNYLSDRSNIWALQRIAAAYDTAAAGYALAKLQPIIEQAAAGAWYVGKEAYMYITALLFGPGAAYMYIRRNAKNPLVIGKSKSGELCIGVECGDKRIQIIGNTPDGLTGTTRISSVPPKQVKLKSEDGKEHDAYHHNGNVIFGNEVIPNISFMRKYRSSLKYPDGQEKGEKSSQSVRASDSHYGEEVKEEKPAKTPRRPRQRLTSNGE